MSISFAVACFFAIAEWLRLLKNERRIARALLEGVRMFGFIACAQLGIWYALRNPNPEVWIACGVLIPVASSLIFNNLHIFLHRRLIVDRQQ
jgi:hypothetical protein